MIKALTWSEPWFAGLYNLPENIDVTYINLNDNTIEGIRCKEFNAYSVQHHPEASPGPHDSRYLFDDFIKLIKSKVYA